MPLALPRAGSGKKIFFLVGDLMGWTQERKRLLNSCLLDGNVAQSEKLSAKEAVMCKDTYVFEVGYTFDKGDQCIDARGRVSGGDLPCQPFGRLGEVFEHEALISLLV